MSPRSRREAERSRSRQPETLESLGLTLASGILLALPFLRPELFWMHYLALAPWAVLLTNPLRRRSWLFFLIGVFASFAMAMGPYSVLSKLVPFWCSLLVYTPWMVVFALVVRPVYLRWRTPLVLLVPIAWVAAEGVRLRYSIGSIGLFPLAASQYGLPALLQIASFTGAAGVSFVVASASGALADLWHARGRGRRGWLAFAGAALLLTMVLAFGAYRLRDPAFRTGPRIAVIQPNEVHYRDPSKARALLDAQLALTRELVGSASVDLIALPENTVDYPYDEDPYHGERLGLLAREQDAAVLAGAFRWARPGPPSLHTSAYYFSAGGDLEGVADKLYLIPWAEYVPFQRPLRRLSPSLARRHAAFAERIVGHRAHGVPGSELRVFDLGDGETGARFAVPICFEITNGLYGRRAADAGADLLLNISSEGFFGAPVYFHMWALSTLRAVENELAVVRVGNNGISGFIDPWGRAQRVVRGRETGRPYLEPGVATDRPRLARSPGTFFSRVGDWLSWTCLLTGVLLAGAARFRRP